MTASRKARTNTPTEQNKEDNSLILYRLQAVEDAVKDLSSKVERMDNLKKADLIEFRDAVIGRITEVQVNLQAQIDKKADAVAVTDLRRLVYGFASVVGSIIVGVSIYYLTNHK